MKWHQNNQGYIKKDKKVSINDYVNQKKKRILTLKFNEDLGYLD
jgi:hypothetical protein